MFVQTVETPNLEALKFIPGVDIAATEMHFSSKDDAGNSFLARKIFDIAGVKSVFFGSDFITVTKNEQANWQILKPEVIMIIIHHFSSGLLSFETPQDHHLTQEIDLANCTEIEKQIIEIIQTRVRPAVAQDGGDIIFKSFINGIVRLELKGSCVGCPSSTITLKNGIESMLKHYVPEVIEVQAVNN